MKSVLSSLKVLRAVKMVQKHKLRGHEEFTKFVESIPKDKLVHFYFSGTIKPDTGKNWCPYCEKAWPVIEKELESVDPDSDFVYVEVGEFLEWKNKQFPFRIDPKTKLRVLPTLLRWNSPRRLEGEQCENRDLVTMLLNEDE